MSNDVADYPNPDLAIEIDLSPSKIDRPGIYAALKSPRDWRFEDAMVSIEQLAADGTYYPAQTSRFLHVRPEEVVRWVLEDSITSLAELEGLTTSIASLGTTSQAGVPRNAPAAWPAVKRDQRHIRLAP